MNYSSYYDASLENGQFFQDFATDTIEREKGIRISQYASRLYQFSKGESREGYEFKYDSKFSLTRNLYIETGEKATQREGSYVPSGIYRKDNSQWYVIGDFDTIYCFDKSVLSCAIEIGDLYRVEAGTKTSVGYLLPVIMAEEIAEFILHPNKSRGIDKRFIRDELARKEMYQKLLAGKR